jgi:hypothetical protein
MIRVLSKFEPNTYGGVEVDTTSRGGFKDLSPFYLGPRAWTESTGLDDGTYTSVCAMNMENLWQYSKVYPEFITHDGKISPNWFEWRSVGFNMQKANRYPMGKGRKPVFSYWMGERLDYISARKKIYIPAYRDLVLRTKSYALLYQWVIEGRDIILRDFDGYDHTKIGMSLDDVINNPKKPMGHAFVIYGLLTGKITL